MIDLDVAVAVSASATFAAVAVWHGSRPELRLTGLGPRAAGARRHLARPAGAPLVALMLHVLGRRSSRAPVRELIEAWSAQLRAGRPVDAALADALADLPGAALVLTRTHASLTVGGDLAAALRRDAGALPDDTVRRALMSAAACWSVARHHGGRLADALDQIAAGVRDDEVHVAQVRAQLAGPRSTAKLLAALPVIALLMASSVGMDLIR